MSRLRFRMASLFNSGSSAAPATRASSSTSAPSKDVFSERPHFPSYHPSSRSLIDYKTELKDRYPPIEPYKTGVLTVATEEEGGHQLYWELSGKQGGYPVVYLHGGPGVSSQTLPM